MSRPPRDRPGLNVDVLQLEVEGGGPGLQPGRHADERFAAVNRRIPLAELDDDIRRGSCRMRAARLRSEAVGRRRVELRRERLSRLDSRSPGSPGLATSDAGDAPTARAIARSWRAGSSEERAFRVAVHRPGQIRARPRACIRLSPMTKLSRVPTVTSGSSHAGRSFTRFR